MLNSAAPLNAPHRPRRRAISAAPNFTIRFDRPPPTPRVMESSAMPFDRRVEPPNPGR